ncbi:MAG: DUF2283 domain-containing protein [Anaerolineae bacterium]|nr:DUF2283 domain-containing protein [Anaerolineae bacterium]
MNPKMRYDHEDNVLMIWFARDKKVDHAEHTGSTILHLSEHDEPILLEILNAREFVPELVRTVMTAAPALTASS